MISYSLNAVGTTTRGEIKRQPCPEACSVVVMADLVYFKHLKWNFSFRRLGFFSTLSKRSLYAVHHQASTTLLVAHCVQLFSLSLLLSSFCRQGFGLLLGDGIGFLGDIVNFAGGKNTAKSFSLKDDFQRLKAGFC